MSFIDLYSSSYNNLSEFGVLANDTITTSSYTPILNNGYYGTTSGVYSPSTNTFSTQSPYGENTSGASSAQDGLSQLIFDISNNLLLPIESLDAGYTSTSVTFLGGNIYKTDTNCAFTSSTIIFDNQGDSNAQFFIVATGYLEFNYVTFELNGVSPCNIFWVSGSYIASTFTDPSSAPFYGNLISGTYITLTYPSSLTGHLFSQTAITITPQTSVNTTTINTSTCSYDPQPIVCYAKGTLILTKRGWVRIENIKAGMKVITKGKIYDNKFIKLNANFAIEPVMWTSKYKVLNLSNQSRPICIKKNALGKNIPFKDLYISPNHNLLINGKMVLAKNILNETTIYQDDECENVEYYHLECENHSAIFANGVLAESYLEFNNRNVFEKNIRLRRKINTLRLIK